MKFKDFLVEKVKKNLHYHKKMIVFTFGRMNPFTFGHYHLAQKLVDEAGAFNKPRIYLSHTTNPKKDPLSYNDKIEFAKKALIYYNIDVKKTKARTIIEVAKELESEGFTDIALVVGSDRVREFKTLLDKYNGKDYNFNSIRVISAGERDPDAEGVEGMSASKVRQFAANGDFENFKKSVPFLPKSAKELYDKVRKGMNIKEEIDLDREIEELLTEGVHDKGIFKAVFLFGGPGSGKDYVLSRTLDGHGLTEINSDKAFEFLMDKEGLDKKMPASEKSKRDPLRGRAKNITELRQRLALEGRNGLIINGTGDDVEKIKRIKEKLEKLGYESSAVMVNTADEVSAQRNVERGQRGGRTVPEDIRKQKWDAVQAARPEYAKLFGQNYSEFDNSEDLRTAPPEVVQQKEQEITELFKNVQKFVGAPPKNKNAKEWVASELDKKDTYKVDTTKEIVPHQGSKAAEQARELGLKYFGFGRYGKNGKVTHRSVHDKLVEVKPQEKKTEKVPVSSSSGSASKPASKPKSKPRLSPFDKLFKENIIKESIDEELLDEFRTIDSYSKKELDDKFKEFSKNKSRYRKLIGTPLSDEFDVYYGGFGDIHKYIFTEKNTDVAVGEFELEGSSSFFERPKFLKPGIKIVTPHLFFSEKYQRKGLARKTYLAFLRMKNYVFMTDRHTQEAATLWNSLAKERDVTTFYYDENEEEVSKHTEYEYKFLGLKSDFKLPKHILEDIVGESYELSDSSALNLLLLGNAIDEHDFKIGEEKEPNLLKDGNGRVRVFMLRAAAAREAHVKNGKVLKYKNGYVVQLKENENVNEVNPKNLRTWFETRRDETPIGWSDQSSNGEVSEETRECLRETTEESKTQLGKFTDNGRSNTITEETSQETSTYKITFAEIRAKKEKLQEETLSEIDKGIEPGVSMAGAGEGIGRDMGEKIKKRSHKVTTVEAIGAGGEDVASRSDHEELKLKRKGIDLQTFRAKRPI